MAGELLRCGCPGVWEIVPHYPIYSIWCSAVVDSQLVDNQLLPMNIQYIACVNCHCLLSWGCTYLKVTHKPVKLKVECHLTYMMTSPQMQLDQRLCHEAMERCNLQWVDSFFCRCPLLKRMSWPVLPKGTWCHILWLHQTQMTQSRIWKIFDRHDVWLMPFDLWQLKCGWLMTILFSRYPIPLSQSVRWWGLKENVCGYNGDIWHMKSWYWMCLWLLMGNLILWAGSQYQGSAMLWLHQCPWPQLLKNQGNIICKSYFVSLHKSHILSNYH